MVISEGGSPRRDRSAKTRGRAAIVPLRIGCRPVINAARLGVQTEAAL